MPAVDQCQEKIVRALQKEGWQVRAAPYRLLSDYRYGYADVELSRGTNGNRELIMLIEIKCFPGEGSTTSDLYEAIGQYLIYRAMIFDATLPHTLYLAVPEDKYSDIFDPIVIQVVNESHIKIVIVNLETEMVVRWIETP